MSPSPPPGFFTCMATHIPEVPCESCGYDQRPASLANPPPRCPHCCAHGQPYATVGWCGWCEDQAGGYGGSPDPGDEMWLCPHGIGHDIWAEGSRP